MSMDLKYLRYTHVMYALVAALIGVFVVFPDLVRELDQSAAVPTTVRRNLPPEIRQNPPARAFVESPSTPPDAFKKHAQNPGKHPAKQTQLLGSFLFFAVVAWGLLWMNHPPWYAGKMKKVHLSSPLRFALVFAVSLGVCSLAIFVHHLLFTGRGAPGFPFAWYKDGVLLFKGLFVLVSVLLFGELFQMLFKQQGILVENETLKTESIKSRLDALSAQISPHFFFNSLNSLSGLIREKENEKALSYIHEISHIFRYILKESGQELVTLGDEIKFAQAYHYLLSIRFEDKLHFTIDVKDAYLESRLLPALSIQPLIENIVKHNEISKAAPMKIHLHMPNSDTLVVENSYQPNGADSEHSGIGLSNLENRYQYLCGVGITCYVEKNRFVVELPLRIKTN